jgi:protein-S-isoprenylcysteine O-methyltransferase Ste14
MNRWRVFLGFVAGAVFAVYSHVASWERAAVGLGLAAAGLALRGWAAGYLEKGKRLAQDGPYAVWRHPLYQGSFWLAFGFCVAGTGGPRFLHGALLWGVFLTLFFWVYPRRVKDEEASLEKYFGDAWRSFVKANFRFLPHLPPLRRADPDRFEWARYRRNREYNALFGYLSGVALIVLKGWLRL